MVTIPREEFENRVLALQAMMSRESIDACFVYGDEYRRENLRYMCNCWPIFERGAILVPQSGEPIVLGAPEGEMMIREMCAFGDIRLVADFNCVTVPEEIEFPLANFTSFKGVFDEMRSRGRLNTLGIVGIDALSQPLYNTIVVAAGNVRVTDANDLLFKLRMTKSDKEVACLSEAARITDLAYEALLKAARPGVTELELAGIATCEAMRHGAEYVPFCLVASGRRVNTVIGRATSKEIEDGDMVLAALAVQYEGYITTFNFPFVVGNASEEQETFISYLVEAFEQSMHNMKAGAEMADLVKAVKGYFAGKGLTEYDLYPPLHGCGVSEAESPYPNENTVGVFEANMTVNTDISIFGHPYGSGRIESCFVITPEGYRSLSTLILRLIEAWKEGRGYLPALCDG